MFILKFVKKKFFENMLMYLFVYNGKEISIIVEVRKKVVGIDIFFY